MKNHSKAYSYPYELFFLLERSDITTNIDKMSLSNIIVDLPKLERELKKHFKLIYDRSVDLFKEDSDLIYFQDSMIDPEKKKKGKLKRFDRIRFYKSSVGKISLLYKRADKRYREYPGYFILTLHQPNKKLESTIQKILTKLKITPIVTKLELAWDFYNDKNLFDIERAINRHLFLKYQRSPSAKLTYTAYTNAIRNSVKGLRVYSRPKKGRKNHIRMELEIHRPIIRKHGIKFPLKEDSLDLDFTKFFCFKEFDHDKYRAFLLKRNRRRIYGLKRKRFGSLIKNVINSRVRGVTFDVYGDEILMKGVERMKQYQPNYSRFFSLMEKETGLIQKVAETQKFKLA